jgi:hypothetical protein
MSTFVIKLVYHSNQGIHWVLFGGRDTHGAFFSVFPDCNDKFYYKLALYKRSKQYFKVFPAPSTPCYKYCLELNI